MIRFVDLPPPAPRALSRPAADESRARLSVARQAVAEAETKPRKTAKPKRQPKP